MHSCIEMEGGAGQSHFLVATSSTLLVLLCKMFDDTNPLCVVGVVFVVMYLSSKTKHPLPRI